MAERPPGKGGPEEGTPEYNWLYGKGNDSPPPDDATRVVPRSSRPRSEETRVMPAMSRDRARGGVTETSPGLPPPPPGGPDTARGAGGRPSGRRLPRFRLRWVTWVLLLWLVFLIAVPFWAWTKVTKINALPDDQLPDQPGNTYLLVGSDSRSDLTEEERKELGTGGDVGQRTDTIMLLHTGAGPNLLMSIPRDSIVEIPGRSGTNKINAAYAFGGPELLVRTIEANTGIRVDDYVEIGFGGFVGMVDALGGVEICPTNAMKDPLANLDIPKGCQEADGKTALGYARSRHTSQQLGDIKRAQHQREVVSAIGSKAISPWTILNPVRYYRLAMASADSFNVSDGTSALSLGRFGYAMTRVDGKNGLTCGVPIRDLAVTWDEERSAEMFRYIIEDDTESIPKGLCTPSGIAR